MPQEPNVEVRIAGRDEESGYSGPQHWRGATEEAAKFVHRPETRLLFDHWRGLWHPGQGPSRTAIDPTAMRAALAHIFLMDYLPEGRRLRYRLAGEEVQGNYEATLAHKHLDEVISPDTYQTVARYFLACPEVPAIVILSGRLYDERDKPGQGERMLLPLFAPDGWAGGLIGITCCESFFASQAEARRSLGRVIRTFPLDGGKPTVEKF